MQNERIIRRLEVESITGLGRSVIYELMAKGEFPKNILIHGRAKGWVASLVFRWVSERIEDAKKLRAESEEEEQNKFTEQQEEDEESEEISA